MQPTRFLPLVLLLASCSDRKAATTAPVVIDQVYAVSGGVYDSVLGTTLPGIRLFMGDSSVVTDSTGTFSMFAPAGAVPLSVVNSGYEPLDRTEFVTHDRILNLRLRRYAPYAMHCAFRGDTLDATIIDLQGRKSINRRSQSTVLATGDGLRILRTAEAWRWVPVDDLTWLVSVPLDQAGAREAEWRVEDQDGFVAPTRCVEAPPPCQDCVARFRAGG